MTISDLDAQPTPYISAVMPCLNEENSLGFCIDKAFSCFERLGIAGEVIVADNGSTDRSLEIAEAHGARVVNVPRKGYGAALIGGIEAAKGQVIVMGDSDDSYDWSALDGFITAIEAGNDLVIGNRFQGGIEPGAMPPLHKYLGNPVLSFISKVAFQIPIGDFHCGMRAFKSDAFKKMELKSTGMEFATEMVASAAQKGLRVGEIPTKLYPDKRGRPPHLRSFRDGWRHLRFILSHSPDYFYLWPGSAMLVIGLTLLFSLASGPAEFLGHYFGIHFIVLGAMLSLIGANVISMGILGKTILGVSPANTTEIARRLFRYPHLLEGALLASSLVAIAGLTIDGMILARWIDRNAGPMEDTIHLAICGSTLAVLGIESIFSSFLFFLVRTRMDEASAQVETPR